MTVTSVVSPTAQPSRPVIPQEKLPVPISHYGVQTDRFSPSEGLLERIIAQENPGVNFQIPKEGIPNEQLPVPMEIVRKAQGNAQPPKPPVTSAPAKSAAQSAATSASKSAEKAAGKTKWGWIVGGIAAVATALGGAKIYSDKQEEKKLDIAA